MALIAKITDVTHEVTTVDENGVETVTDLSLQGRYQVTVSYQDSDNPSNVYKVESFNLPQETSVQEAQNIIIEYGRRVRDARIRVGELRQFVGAVIPIT